MIAQIPSLFPFVHPMVAMRKQEPILGIRLGNHLETSIPFLNFWKPSGN